MNLGNFDYEASGLDVQTNDDVDEVELMGSAGDGADVIVENENAYIPVSNVILVEFGLILQQLRYFLKMSLVRLLIL